MIQPHRVQLSRRKGWRMPPNTVKVDRSTRYGNDFIMAHEGTRAIAIKHFRNTAEGNASTGFYEPLRGKNLACWCPLDKPCHADVLLELANAPPCPENPPAQLTPFTMPWRRMTTSSTKPPPRTVRIPVMTLPDDVVELCARAINKARFTRSNPDHPDSDEQYAVKLARAALEAARYGELVEAVAAFRCAIVAPADAKTIDEADKRLAALLSTIGAA